MCSTLKWVCRCQQGHLGVCGQRVQGRPRAPEATQMGSEQNLTIASLVSAQLYGHTNNR